ncbi:collagen alpha-6(VI) chain-like [Dendronephthya gigantea]|uniref:collagen alpha-6(VI) chain-like n=1 Tax=Dendronephthya gigantea TaxID=151771 RepID=UPI00106AE486|nr:collagen alpha-6(VI) chain-like [Dendronephthya gigantea]
MKSTIVALVFLSLASLEGLAAQRDYSCHEPVDVAVILDTSSYFGSENSPQLKLFAKNFISYFELTINGLNAFVGFIPYSDRIVERSVINFRYSTSAQRLSQKIDRLNFDGSSGSRLDLALRYARETLFTSRKGSRSWVPHVILAVTGSAQYWNPVRKGAIRDEIAELRKAGVRLIFASVDSTLGKQGYLRSLVDSQDDLYMVSYPYLLYGISERITKQVCPVPSTLGCPGKVDIGFIVDSSGSITHSDYNKMKYFMFSIAKAVNISETGARAGIVIYSQAAEMVVKFNDHTSINGFRNVVYNLKHLKSFTRIDLGLQVAHAQLFSPIYGGARPEVKKIAFILTDGKQTAVPGVQVCSLYELLQKKGIHFPQEPVDSGVKTLSIGIGAAVDKEELRAMVEYDEDVITAENFDKLIKSIQNITQQTCEEIAITPCKYAADIAFVLDSSDDVSYLDFQKIKSFAIGVEKRFKISEFGSRYVVIVYGSQAETAVRMNGIQNSTDFAITVGNLRPVGGRRSSYRGLELVETTLHNFDIGARRHAPKVVVMVTAGREAGFLGNANLYQVAKRLRDRNVVVKIVGIGRSLSQNELLPLVESSGDLFRMNSFNDLKDETPAVSDGICKSIEPAHCDKAMDIAFILDSSGSIMKGEFSESRNFVRAISDTFTISPTKAHVALMIYSDDARIMAKFNEIQSKEALPTALEDLPHLRGKTRIDLALKLASASLFTRNGGMRASTSVPKVAIVITDGRQSPAADAIRLDEAAAPLIVRDVKILAIGVGDRIDRSELVMMVKSSEMAFWGSSYQALRVQLAAIAREICTGI